MDTILEKFNHLAKFPDGRIDYSKSNIAPVVTIFVEYLGKILLLKRSEQVSTYKGLWNTVAGYIDEDKPVEEIVKKELFEELSIADSQITSIKLAESFKILDREIGKTWIIYPALVELAQQPNIKLDWEHSEYCWVKLSEIKNYDTVYQLERTLNAITKNTT